MTFWDEAVAQARQNRIEAMAVSPKDALARSASVGGDPVTADSEAEFEAMRRGMSDPTEIALRMAGVYVEKNQDVIEKRKAAALGQMSDFARALNQGSEALEQALARAEASTNAALEQTRANRMAMSTEVNAMLASLKDVASFVRGIEKDGTLETLRALVALANEIKALHGEAFASRLAEALLVASERKAEVR